MKFKEQSIFLRSPLQVTALAVVVSHLPLDPLDPIECLIRKPTKARGLDQNGLYWKRVGEIADQAWFKTKQFDKDVWHIYLGRTVMPDIVVDKDGNLISKYVEVPDGLPGIISTTRLERGFFSIYITKVEAFGASLGVQFLAQQNA